MLHLIYWIIRYSEQKGSDRLVHYIEVWVYLFNLLLLSFMKFFPANLEIFYSTYVRSWDNSQFPLSNLFFDLLHLFHSRQAQCYFHGFFNHFLAIRLLIWLAKEIVRGMIVLYNIVVISQILIYHIT